MTEIQSEVLKVKIRPAGAELVSVQNNDGLEFMWQAKKEIWPRYAPILFPIVGKLKDNQFLFEEKKYELGQHGFARDKNFILTEQNNNSCAFELSSNDETKTNYPFDFDLRISYTLSGNKLTVDNFIKNPGTKNLLFSIGAHPGFRCPLLDSEKFEDYYLEFEGRQLDITQLDNGLRKSETSRIELPEKKMELSTSLFDNDALVFENNQVNRISLRSKRTGHFITMECVGWPFFGIWTKKGCNEFLCLEPWYGIADPVQSNQEFSSKKGIISLKPGADFSCSFSIEFN